MTSPTLISAISPVQASADSASRLPVLAGYGLSLSDLHGFEQALSTASARLETGRSNKQPGLLQAIARPLDAVNHEAASLAERSRGGLSDGNTLSPGELVQLNLKCHEFMFHCQLTSHLANRASDGLQQLFRQQS